MISQRQQEIILETLSPFHPHKISVFGSYARSENKENSDLELLVEFEIEQELSQIPGIKVDLVTEETISPYIRPYVENDLITL